MTKIQNLLAISGIAAMLAFVGASAEADAAIYVKIPGIPGDATSEGYNNGEWFVADSFSFGVERELKKSSGKGGTADINIGIGELQDVTISKSLDSASVLLAQYAINGNSCGAAEIDFVEVAGETEAPVAYLKYKLDRCFVKSWNTSGDADDRPTEEVAFYYNKIAFAYTPTTDGQDPKPVQQMGWDNVKNIPWTAVFDPIRDLLFPPGKSK